MRVRWAIEQGFGDDTPGTVYLTLTDRDGNNVPYSASALRCVDEAEARRLAEQSADGPLTWKPAPADWQPDTYLVSNYYEDEGWSNT